MSYTAKLHSSSEVEEQLFNAYGNGAAPLRVTRAGVEVPDHVGTQIKADNAARAERHKALCERGRKALEDELEHATDAQRKEALLRFDREREADAQPQIIIEEAPKPAPAKPAEKLTQ